MMADCPALDRDGQISRFSYGEFAIVEATASQSQSAHSSRRSDAWKYADLPSQAERGESTTDPTTTISSHRCRSYSRATLPTRSPHCPAPRLVRLCLVILVIGRTNDIGVCSDERQCGSQFGAQSASIASCEGSSWRRRSFHDYH